MKITLDQIKSVNVEKRDRSMMKLEESVRHSAYTIALVVLLNNFIYVIADGFQFADVTKVLFFGAIGITALVLGLFKFHKSLSFGLTIGGLIAGRLAWYYFHFRLTELLQFFIAVLSLGLVCFALYRLYHSQDHLEKTKSKKK